MLWCVRACVWCVVCWCVWVRVCGVWCVCDLWFVGDVCVCVLGGVCGGVLCVCVWWCVVWGFCGVCVCVVCVACVVCERVCVCGVLCVCGVGVEGCVLLCVCLVVFVLCGWCVWCVVCVCRVCVCVCVVPGEQLHSRWLNWGVSTVASSPEAPEHIRTHGLQWTQST